MSFPKPKCLSRTSNFKKMTSNVFPETKMRFQEFQYQKNVFYRPFRYNNLLPQSRLKIKLSSLSIPEASEENSNNLYSKSSIFTPKKKVRIKIHTLYTIVKKDI